MDQWMVGHAQRSYYNELIRAGVTINLYHKPQLVHEKFMSVDDAVGVIGSSNLDIRSFELNLECVAVVYDPSVARTLRKHHNELMQHSHRIQLEAWRRRSYWQSFLDSIARLTSALQ
jgi:cardiolipin synthase